MKSIPATAAKENPPSEEIVRPSSALAPVLQRDFDLNSLPILEAHVVGGKAVLPMALQVEWLAHAAIHGNPGLLFLGINDFRILHGVQWEAGQSIELQVLAGKTQKRDDQFFVPVELQCQRPKHRVMHHSRGEVVLSAKYPSESPRLQQSKLPPFLQPLAEVYRSMLFHGPDLQGIRQIVGMSAEAITARAATAPTPAMWMKRPLRPAWLADPMILDCAFQLLAVWSVQFHGMPCLPCLLGQYRQFRRAFPTGEVEIRIAITNQAGQLIHADIEFIDSQGQLIALIERGEFVRDAALTGAFRKNRLATATV
jgi:hypothetical protein